MVWDLTSSGDLASTLQNHLNPALLCEGRDVNGKLIAFFSARLSFSFEPDNWLLLLDFFFSVRIWIDICILDRNDVLSSPFCDR